MENKKTASHNILEQVIVKGGLMTICAKQYIHDNDLAKQFIIELSEHCHIEEFSSFLGEKLICEIQEFVMDSS